MKSIFVILILMTAVDFCYSQDSIYNFKTRLLAGDTLDFQYFKGRRIFVVNIASESEFSSQLDDLQQLHNHFLDSGLVIIAFPSNDFGREPLTDQDLKTLYEEYSFLITVRTTVEGENASSLFDWFSKKSRNGVADEPVGNDFKKYLIDADGNLVACFSSIIKPTNSIILEAIRNN